MSPLRLALALVAWNNAANRVPGFQRAYVPANLTLAAALLGIGRRSGLDRGPLGLGGGQLRRGVAWGAGAAALSGVVAAGLRRRLGGRLADRRLQGQRLATVLALRIPLGTAVPEEVAFRGVLLGLAGGRALGPSVAFGLWHVTPTLALLDANRPDATPRERALVVAGAVVLTTAAGAGLCHVRRASGGLLGPILVHAAVNDAAAAAAYRRPMPSRGPTRRGG